MAVMVKTECQECEDIREEEFNGVLVLGFQTKSGVPGITSWHHELNMSEIAELLSWALGQLSESIKSKERGQ